MCEEPERQKIYCISLSIATMVFSIGQRVFVGSTSEYGTVTKNRFLGKNGLVILLDTGSMEAFEPKNAKAEIYDKETGTNDNGETIEPPLDVREEGIAILNSLSIPEEDQRLYFYKFIIGLSREEQESYVNEFNSVKGDETAKQTFLDDLLSELNDENNFVQTEGSRALFNVEESIRTNMFQNLTSKYSKEQREALILEWMVVRNLKRERGEFLHTMYKTLMTDDEFIKVEGIKALSEMGVNSETQGTLFAKFIEESDEQTKQAFIAQWETVRSSRSKRHEFIKNVIAGLQANA